MNILRLALTNLSRDKEKLLIDIDKRITENECLKKENEMKRKKTEELTAHICNLETKLHNTNEEFCARHNEIDTLRMQLDRTNEVNCDLNKLYDSALKENKRLQEEMLLLTKDNKCLNCEIVKVSAENISLRERIENLKCEYQKVN